MLTAAGIGHFMLGSAITRWEVAYLAEAWPLNEARKPAHRAGRAGAGQGTQARLVCN